MLKKSVVFLLTSILLLTGCGQAQKKIMAISEADAAIIPAPVNLTYTDIMSSGGELWDLEVGTFGGAMVVWHTVRHEGIEYYFYELTGDYDPAQMVQDAASFSIIGEEYKLSCGLGIKDSVDDILSKYPNLARTDFSDQEMGYIEKYSCYGFNKFSYPGEWTKQFDYALMADVDNGTNDDLPQYLALMIKNEEVVAITFFYPTAG